MAKQYDRAYFDKWYRNRQTRVSSAADVRRKVSMVVSVTEYFLRRPIRNVLDIGCGEGAWLAHLQALRPKIRYAGYDSSDYVVERFGASRNIRKATFGQLPSLPLKKYDLVICSDVLHYVEEGEIREGVSAIARATEGLAFLEVLTAEDDIVGDLTGLIRRPAAFYRKLFNKAGMMQVSPYSWLPRSVHAFAAELEIAG